MVRRVLLQLSLQEGWGPVGWASDWGKNIYAPTAFLGDAGDDEPRIFTVRTQFTAPDGSSVDKTWKVTVKYAATVDLGALNRYIQGADAEEDAPRSAIQVLEVVMRSGVSGECVCVVGGGGAGAVVLWLAAVHCIMHCICHSIAVCGADRACHACRCAVLPWFTSQLRTYPSPANYMLACLHSLPPHVPCSLLLQRVRTRW
jgi:hypothetical protein